MILYLIAISGICTTVVSVARRWGVPGVAPGVAPRVEGSDASDGPDASDASDASDGEIESCSESSSESSNDVVNA